MESNNNEGGRCEGHSKQPMLSPTASQRILAQTEAENEGSSSAKQLATQEQRRKGKKMVETEESITSELLTLLKDIKVEVR